jgi:hypothetical protein
LLRLLHPLAFAKPGAFDTLDFPCATSRRRVETPDWLSSCRGRAPRYTACAVGWGVRWGVRGGIMDSIVKRERQRDIKRVRDSEI